MAEEPDKDYLIYMATMENKDKRKRKTTGKKKAKVSHIIKPDNLSMEDER